MNFFPRSAQRYLWPRALVTALALLCALGAPGVAGASSAPPGKPSAVVASYSGGSVVDISWTAPSINSPATSLYTVTSSPGGYSCTSTVTTCALSDLLYGVTYSFSVVATNSVGTGPASAPSNQVTYLGDSVPSAPQDVVATYVEGAAYATIYWNAPANATPSVTSYSVLSSPGNVVCTSTKTDCNVFGLTSGDTYSFVVTATNSVGVGLSSVASNEITFVTAGLLPKWGRHSRGGLGAANY